jgi:hypothetical protein
VRLPDVAKDDFPPFENTCIAIMGEWMGQGPVSQKMILLDVRAKG